MYFTWCILPCINKWIKKNKSTKAYSVIYIWVNYVLLSDHVWYMNVKNTNMITYFGGLNAGLIIHSVTCWRQYCKQRPSWFAWLLYSDSLPVLRHCTDLDCHSKHSRQKAKTNEWSIVLSVHCLTVRRTNVIQCSCLLAGCQNRWPVSLGRLALLAGRGNQLCSFLYYETCLFRVN